MSMYKAKRCIVGYKRFLADEKYLFPKERTLENLSKFVNLSLSDILQKLSFVGLKYCFLKSITGSDATPAGCVAAIMNEKFKREQVPLSCGILKRTDQKSI